MWQIARTDEVRPIRESRNEQPRRVRALPPDLNSGIFKARPDFCACHSSSAARPHQDVVIFPWIRESNLQYVPFLIIHQSVSRCLPQAPASVLLINAIAVLSEDRFLARGTIFPLPFCGQSRFSDELRK